MVDEVAEDVNLAAFVRGAQLAPRNDLDAMLLADADGIVDGVYAVMIGDADYRKADVFRLHDELLRCQRTVGFRRVHVQICPSHTLIPPGALGVPRSGVRWKHLTPRWGAP